MRKAEGGRRKEEGKLLELFEQLTSEQQEKLIAFAEFLTADPAGEAVAPEPLAIRRPAAETVTMAIRRLVRSYPMLERRHLMGEASQLLAQHVLQGRTSAEVIDDLEALFVAQYERHRAKVEKRKAKR
jgi:hypothetical protein